MTETIEELHQRIQACRRDSWRKSISMSDIAIALESLTLTSISISQEIFRLYTEVLTDEVLCEKPHTASFIPALFSDFDKLSAAQRDALLEIFIKHAPLYRSQILQFSVGDIIARKYPCDTAIQAFQRMWLSRKLYAKDIAQYGANVLSLTLTREGNERSALQNLERVMKMGSPS